MKKFVLLTGIAAMTVMMSCKKEEPVEQPAPTPIIVHETVVQPTTPPPPPPPPVEERVDKDGTKISVSSKGVSLDTKSGKKSTTVTVKDGEAAIDIGK